MSINKEFTIKTNYPASTEKNLKKNLSGQKIVPCSLFRILNNMMMCYHNHEVKNFCKICKHDACTTVNFSAN